MFIPQSIQDGALCAVSEKRIESASYPYIMVNSCAQALKDIAEHYRRSLRLKVVGISGSVGKTSTKEMIASVLAQKYSVLKTEGNFNNEIGLPLTIFNIREEHETAVLEMGISDFGEMERLAKIARPDVCVLTNIGCAHLEQLKSREGILKAKTEMFFYMNPEGDIILNGDDDMLASVKPVSYTHLDVYKRQTLGSWVVAIIRSSESRYKNTSTGSPISMSWGTCFFGSSTRSSSLPRYTPNSTFFTTVRTCFSPNFISCSPSIYIGT